MSSARFGADDAPPPRTRTRGGAAEADEPALGELVRRLARQSSTLVRQEIELAKQEVGQSVAQAARGGAGLAVWGAVALTGGLVLLVFLVLLLGDLLDNHWLSTLIVGALLTLGGGLLALRGVRRIRGAGLAPRAALQSLRQDRAWVQSEIDQLKRDLT